LINFAQSKVLTSSEFGKSLILGHLAAPSRKMLEKHFFEF
jgi:hypothetical protein